MYLTKGHTYYMGSEQCISRGLFLILVQSHDLPLNKDNFRAIVRKVAMRQCGHFMMGIARIKGQSVILSGTYGGDGLPVTVSQVIFDMAIPVPHELYAKWAQGGGWNSSGIEAMDMYRWAIDTFKIKEVN
jgi:predicted RNA-binding protein with TRAM domain